MLFEALEVKGVEVCLSIIASRVGNTIYKTTQSTLQDMGNETEPINKLFRILHQHAVESEEATCKAMYRHCDVKKDSWTGHGANIICTHRPPGDSRDVLFPIQTQPLLGLAGSLT